MVRERKVGRRRASRGLGGASWVGSVYLSLSANRVDFDVGVPESGNLMADHHAHPRQKLSFLLQWNSWSRYA